MALPSGTLTLLFSDIEGSTRLLDSLGDERYGELLAEHQRIVRDAVSAHRGEEVDTQGDAFFVVFPRAADAVAAAVAIQRDLARQAWPPSCAVRLRMGLHSGTPILTERDYFGMVVHEAARICAAAHGGQVVLSDAAQARVATRLPDGVDLLELGEHMLKDIPEPMRLHQLLIAGLPDRFPPLRSLGDPPSRLPDFGTPLVGRSAETQAALRLLRDEGARLVTFTGPGGTGKTRLAVDVAAQLRGDFPGGTFFVGLGSTVDSAHIMPAIAATLGVADRAQRTVEETLFDHLRGRAALLVLDNLEQLSAAGAVVSLLCESCPSVTVLATSRAPLHLRAEHVMQIGPLAVRSAYGESPAVELFVERARAVQSGFVVSGRSADAVEQICAHLDGLPLAIELAAARIRVMAPETMLRRLERRLALLVRGPVDLPERQRTLEATIAWSYDLLGERERRAFERLAVFPSGWSIEASEAVCADVDDGDVLGALESLVEQSVVVAGTEEDGAPRFWMLETVREFALARLHDAGEYDAACRRMAEHYLAVAGTAWFWELSGPDLLAQVALLDAEVDNVRATMAWARAAREDELRLELAARLWYFMELRGALTEVRGWLREALAGAPREPTPSRLVALSGACGLAAVHGDAEAVAAERAELEALLADVRDPAVRALALIGLAMVATERGELDTARKHYAQAVGLARAGSDHLLCMALNNLGDLELQVGALDEALATFDESLTAGRRAGSAQSVPMVLVNIAIAWLALGDEQAERYFREALDAAELLDDRRIVVAAVQGLGWCAARHGSHETAARLLGCVDACRQDADTPVTGIEQRLEVEVVAGLRAELGDERFAELWHEGGRMPLADAIAYALDREANAGIVAAL